jgi:hypothetical protein
LPLADLQAEYQQTVGMSNSSTRNRSYLVKRILFVKQHADRKSPEATERRRREREVKREQDLALGVARGTHCFLACDRCHVEVVVPVRVRHELKRDRDRGGPSRFLCAECQDKEARRSHEREGLERTRKEIEKERQNRADLSAAATRDRPQIADWRRSSSKKGLICPPRRAREGTR